MLAAAKEPSSKVMGFTPSNCFSDAGVRQTSSYLLDKRNSVMVFTDACYERDAKDLVCGLGTALYDELTKFVHQHDNVRRPGESHRSAGRKKKYFMMN